MISPFPSRRERSLALVLSLLASASVLAPSHAGAQNGKLPGLNAEAVLLRDAGGKILFDKNAEDSHAPASLVKLMTLYLAYEDLEAGRVRWDEPVTITASAARTPAHRMGLRAGELVLFGTLLEGLAIASANDAATAVAEHLSGDEPSFVARMNAEAQALGLTATRFANPHGLPDPLQRSTARDLAALMAKLLQNHPTARTLLGAKTFAFGDKMFSRRLLFLEDSWGVHALKTGFTSEAGYNLALEAGRNGQTFLAILLGAPSRGRSFRDAQKLLEYGLLRLRPEPPAQERRPLPRRSATRTRLALPPAPDGIARD